MATLRERVAQIDHANDSFTEWMDMGPYCKFCNRRCFVLRVLRDNRSMLLATCASGMTYDREKTGEDHTTALNPITGTRGV